MIRFESDVNAPALCVALENRASPLSRQNFAYITVGTGVGVGLFVNGSPVHGELSPEFGHLAVPRTREDESFESSCTFHSSCVEGLICIGALARRANLSTPLELVDLPDSHELFSRALVPYTAELCAAIVLALSPSVIVVGGGIFAHRHALFEQLRRDTNSALNGYVACPRIEPSPHGDDAGLWGARAVALFKPPQPP